VSKEDLDAAINLIAAVNAGVIQAIARRGYEHLPESCATMCGLEVRKS
jgi:hypothetical protein